MIRLETVQVTVVSELLLFVGAAVDVPLWEEIYALMRELGNPVLAYCAPGGLVADPPRINVRLICLLSDPEIRELLAHPEVAGWQLVFLPTSTNRQAQLSFGVPSTLGTALRGALEIANTTRVDLYVSR